MAEINTSTKIQIPLTVKAARRAADEVADSILQEMGISSDPEMQRDPDQEKSELYANACSTLMDVYLEGDHSKTKAVVDVLKSRISASEWETFKKDYIDPSVGALSAVKNSGLLAESMAVIVDVRSKENIEKLGLSVNKNQDGSFTLSFGSKVNGVLDGQAVTFGPGERNLTFGKDFLAFELVEKNGSVTVNFIDSNGKGHPIALEAPSGRTPNGGSISDIRMPSVEESQRPTRNNSRSEDLTDFSRENADRIFKAGLEQANEFAKEHGFALSNSGSGMRARGINMNLVNPIEVQNITATNIKTGEKFKIGAILPEKEHLTSLKSSNEVAEAISGMFKESILQN